MRLPSWSEFKEKLDAFEKEAGEKVGKLKKDYPMLDRAIQAAITVGVPPPFNFVARNIYNSFNGTPKEKSDEVLNYFNYLKNKGEKHYEEVATKLDSVLINVQDLKQFSAKEETVENIKDILISSSNQIDQKLVELQLNISEMNTNVTEIKEDQKVLLKGQESMQSDIDVIKQQLVVLVGREQQTLEQVNIEPKIIEEKAKTPEITHEIVSQIEQIREEKEDLHTQLEKLGEKPDVNVPLTIAEANFDYRVGNFDGASELYDKVLEVDPENEIAKKNKELTVGKLDKILGKQKTFRDKNIDLKKLAQKMEQFFSEKKFKDIQLDEDPKGKWFVVKAKKGGIGSTLGGTRKAIHILIQGKPERFKVEMTTGEWGKNMAITASTAFLTWGISAGIGMAANAKFRGDLWKFIEESVESLQGTKEP